jgi:uncharacterized membrane protein YedE/YeeE
VETYSKALLGGALIGFASLLMLYGHGKILGISGIAGGLFRRSDGSRAWRALFLAGLLVGGTLVLYGVPGAFEVSVARSPWALVTAGLLVGYGTRLGNGCTSGHGICGVSRFSSRSLVATAVFMASGAAIVFVINHVLGGRL